MAAYAALVSLMNTMDQIQIHPRLSASFNKSHLESLGDTVNFLLYFIESYNSGGSSEEVEDLESRIAAAAHTAEDAIESRIVDLIRKDNDGKPVEFHLPSVICDLQKVTEDVKKVGKQGRSKYQTPNAASSSSRSVSAGSGRTRMMGFDGYLLQLMDKLTAQRSHPLLILPIVGMGGVGKTTLARNAFESLTIKQHFDVCAWVTISQSYSCREILLQLLHIQYEDNSNIGDLGLGEKLHKYLFGRRYLIILDDVWSIEIWDDMKFYFPDNNNGSCVVLTTRIRDVALHFNSSFLAINFLDEDKSWDLFCQESFGEEVCPAELEEVGKKICGNCKGLPLCIVVIGGFLRKSSKAVEFWEGIARDTYSILSLEEENQVMNILSLSYSHLPAQLKPCFLYMGVFAEDEEIIVSRLIKRWVAEGFVRPNDSQTLEEVADGYFKDLVDMNLILVRQRGSNGKKIRTCNIHDLIRELCLMVAKKEKFLCVMNFFGTPRAIDRKCRTFTERGPKIFLPLGSESLVSSLMYKVLYEGLLEAGLRYVNLRSLDHVIHSWDLTPLHISKKIFFLWNLQTVIIDGYGAKFPESSELWKMIQLRHLKVSNLCLSDPQNDRVDLLLPNLQTFCMVMNLQLSEEVCKRIPNVKKLGLEYTMLPERCEACSYYCPQNLGRFHKLESLALIFINKNWRHVVVNMTFPSSLKKLSLNGGGLYWKDLRMIGSLPNLEVLKLSAMELGSEWNPVEGEFCRLKFLLIRLCALTEWNVDHSHFPVLEKLVLVQLNNLDEIPSGIGEIPTLQIIRLYECSVPFSLSAVKLLEEQEANGTEDLQLEVGFATYNNKDTERFKEMMEQEGFTSKNLHITRSYNWND